MLARAGGAPPARVLPRSITHIDRQRLRVQIDDSGNGFVSRQDIVSAFQRHLGDQLSDEQVHEIMTEVDDNKDGNISFSEFVTVRSP